MAGKYEVKKGLVAVDKRKKSDIPFDELTEAGDALVIDGMPNEKELKKIQVACSSRNKKRTDQLRYAVRETSIPVENGKEEKRIAIFLLAGLVRKAKPA